MEYYCKYAPHRTSNTILMITIGQDVMFHHMNYGVTDKVLYHNSKIFIFLYYTMHVQPPLDLDWCGQQIAVFATLMGPTK